MPIRPFCFCYQIDIISCEISLFSMYSFITMKAKYNNTG